MTNGPFYSTIGLGCLQAAVIELLQVISACLGQIKKIACLASIHPNFSRSGGRGFFGVFLAMKLILSLLYNGVPVCTYI